MSTMMSNWRRILFLVLTIWTARAVNSPNRCTVIGFFPRVYIVRFVCLLCEKNIVYNIWILFDLSQLIAMHPDANKCAIVCGIRNTFRCWIFYYRAILVWKKSQVRLFFDRESNFLWEIKKKNCSNFKTNGYKTDVEMLNLSNEWYIVTQTKHML